MPQTLKSEIDPPPAAVAEDKSRKIRNFRWVICALLFIGTTVNYIDRQVIGLLKPLLETQFQWTETDYANIVFCFQLAYAIGLLFVGGLLDRIGIRLGFALAVVFWSIAAVAHGFMRTVTGFAAARFGLGLAESANFPASIKAVGEWFPKKERALATGLFNSGTNAGALVTPLLVPWLAANWGWQSAFYVTGVVGVLWVFMWWPVYRSPEAHAMVSAAEPAPASAAADSPASRARFCCTAWNFPIGRSKATRSLA